ncbi:phospholipase A and acyltransferase 5 isoform X1 [Balaenoptera musculus]|uniref:Phospholipase A and acyltransferase 5 isoform X1 n=1 Tax=Balaenoptera musculus TaxID=9771 RepID=A0A8B8YDA8_BALMU|nr:phospholipase A and acyltransferase 5 isoform X1 [Balaenoptera musculus]
MGLSPAAERECGRLLPRFPRPRLRPASRTGSVRTNDTQPAPGLSPGPQSGRRGRGAPPHQAPTPGPGTFRGRSPGPSRPSDPPEREKPLESTPNQKRAEWNSAPEPGSAGRLIKQAAEGKPRPRPGDLIEIFQTGYEHWAVYVEDGCVVHLAPTSEEFEASGIASVFSNRAVVTYSRLEDVLRGCSWKVNNKLDGTYLPLPVDKIVQQTKKMINKIVQYSLIEGNCEHFVNDLRYGVPRSQQVEHMLMGGAKAAGAVLSAVVDSLRPKPAMARRL